MQEADTNLDEMRRRPQSLCSMKNYANFGVRSKPRSLKKKKGWADHTHLVNLRKIDLQDFPITLH